MPKLERCGSGAIGETTESHPRVRPDIVGDMHDSRNIPTNTATPPVTLEGWYACHQLFTVDREKLRRFSQGERESVSSHFVDTLNALQTPAVGWTRAVLVTGSHVELMVMHFRPSLDELGQAQRRLLATPLADALRVAGTYLSVAEAGMYALVAELSRGALARNGSVGDEEYNSALAARLEQERTSPHVQQRLFPQPPTAEMPYVCYYPMSKRRAPGQNWYELAAEDRSRLMWEHGKSGRRHAGRIRQIVSGSIGLAEWEWGVTLFGTDPLNFKKAVTDMRFDEASARYADFGDFFVGRTATAAEILEALMV